MKELADQKRRDVSFEVGDIVLVKLRPRRQITATNSSYSKLAKRFYGPFQVTQCIGEVAYKLDLPATSKIHPVFHYSLLKSFRSHTIAIPLELPASSEDNQPLITPLTILDSKWEITASGKQLLVLVQWKGLFPEDSSWEKWDELRQNYNLEDKVVLEARGDDMEEEQNREHYAATELKDAEAAVKTEQVKGPNKEERRRTKRELNKSQYLKDYTMN